MRKRLLFLLQYSATLILLLAPPRIIFTAICDYHNHTLRSYAETVMQSLPTDLAIAGCATIVPLLLAILPRTIKIPFKKIIHPYNIAVAFLMAAILIADSIIYSRTGCRLNHTHLLRLIDTPEDILTSLTIGYLFTRFALLVATTTLFSLILYKVTPEKFDNNGHGTLHHQ